MKKVIVFIVAVAVLGWFKMSDRGDVSDQTLGDMREIIESMDEYPRNEVFLDSFLKLAHVRAFGDTYDIGTKRRDASFDQEAYLTRVFDELIEECGNHKKPELADALRELRKEVYIEEEEGL